MKHEITSLNTKKTFSASLKKLICQKPFSRITVSEIIADCGLNRNTFYYHFENIHDLLCWTLEQEAINIVQHFDLVVDYREAIQFVLEYVDNNRDMLKNIVDSVERGELKHFFYNDFIEITKNFIDEIDRQQKIGAPDDFKIFLTHFCSEALAGVILESITNRIPNNHEQIISNMSIMMNTGIASTLRAAAEKYSDTDIKAKGGKLK